MTGLLPRQLGLQGSGQCAPWPPEHVHVAVLHWRSRLRPLLLHLLTGRCELLHLADVGGLGGLTPVLELTIGIHEDKDVRHPPEAGRDPVRRSRCRRPSRRRQDPTTTSWFRYSLLWQGCSRTACRASQSRRNFAPPGLQLRGVGCTSAACRQRGPWRGAGHKSGDLVKWCTDHPPERD